MSLEILRASLRGLKKDSDDADESLERVGVRVRTEVPKMKTAMNEYLRFVLSAASESTDSMDDVNSHAEATKEAVGQTIAEIAVAWGEAQKLSQAVEAEYQATLQRLVSHSTDLFDFGGVALEEFVSGQRELIEQIENTPFGGYLDNFAKAYIAIQSGLDTDGRFYKTMEESQRLIQYLGGSAGQKFDFFKFQQDIDAALKGLKDAIANGAGVNTAGSGAYGGYGSTSGSLGKQAGQPCGGAQMPLSIQMRSGGLRWVR